MSRRLNGHAAPLAPQNSDYELTCKLLNEYKEKWNQQFKESSVDAALFTRLSLVALTQWAAILAVDVGMQPEHFEAVCNIQFAEAHKNAPRFGN